MDQKELGKIEAILEQLQLTTTAINEKLDKLTADNNNQNERIVRLEADRKTIANLENDNKEQASTIKEQAKQITELKTQVKLMLWVGSVIGTATIAGLVEMIMRVV